MGWPARDGPTGRSGKVEGADDSGSNGGYSCGSISGGNPEAWESSPVSWGVRPEDRTRPSTRSLLPALSAHSRTQTTPALTEGGGANTAAKRCAREPREPREGGDGGRSGRRRDTGKWGGERAAARRRSARRRDERRRVGRGR